MSDKEERKFECTKCGRIGTVGRCCGRDTREAVCKVKDIDLSDLANFPPPPDSDAKRLVWLRSSR